MKVALKRDVKIFQQISRPSRVVRKSADFTRRRRNFLPTLILAVLFWIGWGFIVFKTAPINNLLLIIFYLLLFLAIFLTTALIFANSRRGFFTAFFVILFFFFRQHQISNILNLILLAGILISLEIYFC